MIGIMLVDHPLWATDGEERRLSAGEALFRAGDPVRRLYRVESGTLRLVRLLPQGSELTVQRAAAGSILAEASLFAAAYHCDALALTEACIRGIPVGRAREVLEGDRHLARAFTAYLAQQVQAARTRAEIIGLRTTRERVDAWLSLSGGVMPPKGRWHEIAHEVGVTPEALYRELARRRRE